MKTSKERLTEYLLKISNDLSYALLYTHTRINDNTKKTLEAASFLYALIELLEEKGIISIEELDERKKQVAERLLQKFTESGIGLMYQEPEYDKYAFEHEACVDCQGRIQICKAICCKLPFALSSQDVDEGIIRWEFGRPYLIGHNSDGYCVHLDKNTYHCAVHQHRPVPCRGFDCKDNEKWKIWLYYENKIVNPGFDKHINAGNGKFYTYSKR